MLFTIVIGFAQGFNLAALTPAHCHGAMRLLVVLNLPMLAITVFPSPVIITIQNIFCILLNLIVFVSSFIASVFSADRGRNDLVEPIQLLCSLCETIIGGMMVLNSLTRLICVQCIGVQIVPRVEIFRRMRKDAKKVSLERLANEMMEIVVGNENSTNSLPQGEDSFGGLEMTNVISSSSFS